MAEADRSRWNAKVRAGAGVKREPSAVLEALAEWLPARGRVLDVAGGTGANAIWLAQRGLELTIVDISDAALELASARAATAHVALATVRADLEQDPLPPGPWDLIVCSHYLQRDLLPGLAAVLAPGGRLIWLHPTRANLERHQRPNARFLLEAGEAAKLVRALGLALELDEESWVGGGAEARHLARVVATRRQPGVDS